MAEKYRLEWEGDMYRVVATRRINTIAGTVTAGTRGGLVVGPHNLAQKGNCWIGPDVTVSGSAEVLEDAVVLGNVEVTFAAVISGMSFVEGSRDGKLSIEGASIYNSKVNICDTTCHIVSDVVLRDCVVTDSSLAGSIDLTDCHIVDSYIDVDDLQNSGLDDLTGTLIHGAHVTAGDEVIAQFTPWGVLALYRVAEPPWHRIRVGCQEGSIQHFIDWMKARGNRNPIIRYRFEQLIDLAHVVSEIWSKRPVVRPYLERKGN